MSCFPRGSYFACLIALMLAVPVSADETAKKSAGGSTGKSAGVSAKKSAGASAKKNKAASKPVVKQETRSHRTYMKRTWGVEVRRAF